MSACREEPHPRLKLHGQIQRPTGCEWPTRVEINPTMSKRVLRPRVEVCQLCDFILARQWPVRQPYRLRTFTNTRAFSTAKGTHGKSSQALSTQPTKEAKAASPKLSAKFQSNLETDVTHAELEQTLQEVQTTCDSLFSLNGAPSEEETMLVLRRCQSLARLLTTDPSSATSNKKDVAASVLLTLDDSNEKKIPTRKAPAAIQRIVDQLSAMVYSIVKHPPVFISPEILEEYVEVQAALRKPESLPEVFNLYANKPVPQEGTSPIQYTVPNPNKISNAVPAATADRALQAAIETKQLVVAMDIIEYTYTTKAFHRAKFLRRGLLPVTGLAVAPVAAYTAASRLAVLQTSMDSALATNVAFAGILAYVGFTATIGIVAVTTANDQMDRVTWAQGMPLRQRWIREEERAAIDKIAGAWGFRESWRRGEEEGDDWDALREWTGRKGMMLDRVELMEGME